VAALNFSVNLAAPYFSVFMPKDLGFNYFTHTLLVTEVSFAQILSIDRWGSHIDRVGNLKILRLTSFIIASLLMWWIINRNPLFLIFIQLLSGFAWAGFNLCATNFIYDAVTPAKRTRCIAYFNAITGLPWPRGLLVGCLINIFPKIFGFRILSLFLVFSILRFLLVILISRKIKNIRKIDKIKSKDLFYSVLGLRTIFKDDQIEKYFKGF